MQCKSRRRRHAQHGLARTAITFRTQSSKPFSRWGSGTDVRPPPKKRPCVAVKTVEGLRGPYAGKETCSVCCNASEAVNDPPNAGQKGALHASMYKKQYTQTKARRFFALRLCKPGIKPHEFVGPVASLSKYDSWEGVYGSVQYFMANAKGIVLVAV